MVKRKKTVKKIDNSWKEYLDLLRQWVQTFESLQRVGIELQIKYIELMGKTLTDPKNINMTRQLVENWQKFLNQLWQENLQTRGK